MLNNYAKKQQRHPMLGFIPGLSIFITAHSRERDIPVKGLHEVSELRQRHAQGDKSNRRFMVSQILVSATSETPPSAAFKSLDTTYKWKGPTRS